MIYLTAQPSQIPTYANIVFVAATHFNRNAQSPIVKRTNTNKFNKFAAFAKILRRSVHSVCVSWYAKFDKKICNCAEVLLSHNKAAHLSIHLCSKLAERRLEKCFDRLLAPISITQIHNRHLIEEFGMPPCSHVSAGYVRGIPRCARSVHKLGPYFNLLGSREVILCHRLQW